MSNWPNFVKLLKLIFLKLKYEFINFFYLIELIKKTLIHKATKAFSLFFTKISPHI